MAASPSLQRPDLPLFPGFVSQTHDPGTLSGTVTTILHTDLDSGFTVVRLKLENGKEAVACGKADPLVVGDVINADGAWEAHATWGRQFKARFIRADVPENTAGIVRYLGSGAISGIGQRTAERLGQFFGDKLPEVMATPTTLMAAGLDETRARRITEHWTLRTRHARLLSFLYAHGVGTKTAQKIIGKYGDNALRIVSQTPYRLAREIHGIGFKIADRMALSQGRAKDSVERIQAAIEHQLEQISREGHCASGRTVLAAAVSKLLTLPLASIEAQVNHMLVQGDLVEELIGGRPVVYLRSMRECEIEVAQSFASRRAENPVPPDIETRIANATAALKLPPLHENQVRAIVTAIGNSVSVVTGNPGTGKTSTVSVLLAVLRELAPEVRIALVAPTGRAAKRMTESTGFEASTIHRRLEWSPEEHGFLRNKDNQLDCDVLVMDESSMLDIWLTRDLLRAVPPETRLIIVGDVDQLPSVGPGNVLADLIESATIPVVRLTHIFRQGAGSAIAAAAQQINSGVVPRLVNPNPSRDMWGVFVETPEQVVEKLTTLVRDIVPKMGFDPLKDLQILTSGHQTETGTIRLNAVMQEILNPRKPGQAVVRHKDREFRVNDRVIQVTNNYDDDVFNGDIGRVTSVVPDGEEGGSVTIDFDGNVITYDRDLDQLQHAYCVTIHKSQGSEFPVVVVVITTQHYVMLRRNLIYTGVSRARKLGCVVGFRRALAIAVRTGGVGRVTGLAQRLASFAAAHDALGAAVEAEQRREPDWEAIDRAGAMDAGVEQGDGAPPWVEEPGDDES